MLCENCGEREAGIRVTRIADGSARTVDLCAACAGLPATGSMLDLLAGLLGAAVSSERGAQPDVRCAGCGLTFDAFAETQLLGCARCYAAFAPRLEPLLMKIQAHGSHDGKIPARGGRELREARTASKLRTQLEEAVAHEQYERAAELRDRLRLTEARSEEA
ncbi:hypothetical protein EPN52_14275 [bacterium]|nr:MAG: hypothetical protein EPN52_14275 [bacterium]